MWNVILDRKYGVANNILEWLTGTRIDWRGDPKWYRFGLIFMTVWSTTGYKIIILTAALTSVNKNLYEAADYIVKKCADFAVGGQLGNWSLNVPSKAGEYVIYAVPVDIYGTTPQTPYEGIYKSSFSVASEEDPVVGIDSQFRGSTIVEKTKITGYFYDNNKVKTIDVSLKFDAEDKEEKITLYDFSKPEDKNEIKVYKRDNTFQLVTGQTVVKNFFEWEFDTQRFKAFKVLQMTLSAEDDDGNYGEDAVMIYGDSERPVFVGEISPANNSDVSDTNVFEGTVSDNVEVVEVTIKASGSWGEKVWKCTLGDAQKDKNGKSERTFKSDSIFPNDFGGYIDSEFTITAKDAAGNESNHIIFLKGDKSKPSVLFVDESGNIEKSGIYVTASKSLNIRIKPVMFGDGSYREVTGVNYSVNGSELKKLTLGVKEKCFIKKFVFKKFEKLNLGKLKEKMFLKNVFFFQIKK
jgi:hypothetical protein